MHAHYTGALVADDDPAGQMDVEEDTAHMPEGSEAFHRLSREEEWTLARESTAGFAGWFPSCICVIMLIFSQIG